MQVYSIYFRTLDNGSNSNLYFSSNHDRVVNHVNEVLIPQAGCAGMMVMEQAAGPQDKDELFAEAFAMRCIDNIIEV